MLNNVDYDNLCEHAGARVMDGDHIVKDVVAILNNFPTKEAALAASTAMAREAALNGSYLRAFICDCAERELTTELEGELG